MIARLLSHRPALRLSLFIGLICLANLVLYQGPTLRFALGEVDLHTGNGWLTLATLEVLQTGLTAVLLYAVSLAGMVALRLVVSALFLINAFALYFMQAYGVELDVSMIANILNTDTREAGDLWSPAMLPTVLGLGVLPVLAVWWVKIAPPRWLVRVAGGTASLVLLLGWVYGAATTWLWFDQHATRLGGQVLPWSYIFNTARHYAREAAHNRVQELLPDARFAQARPAKKQIVVLVVGEAARADDLGAYGYGRDTTPFTEGKGLVVFPAGMSCATNTIASTACILTHEGREASSRTTFEPLPSYMQRMGIDTIYRTNNSGPPPVKTREFMTARKLAEACEGADCPDPELDGALLLGLEEDIRASEAPRVFVTLHFTGSHGPAYWKKYPKDFEVFTPVCETVQVSECSHEALVNAYDNTIRYTDYLLAQVIGMLAGMEEADSALIYVPDHGQSLGEGGFYLHGAPLAVAPVEQRRVPFEVWMSDGFMADRHVTRQGILRSETFPHDFPFHSVMGAFGMTSPIYKPQYDIFSTGG